MLGCCDHPQPQPLDLCLAIVDAEVTRWVGPKPSDLLYQPDGYTNHGQHQLTIGWACTRCGASATDEVLFLAGRRYRLEEI